MAQTVIKCTKVAVGAYLAWKAWQGLSEVMDERHTCLKGTRPGDRLPPTGQYKPHFFQNAQGLWIFRRAWLPKTDPVGLVFIVHGVGEHCGRYEHVAAALNACGFAVFSMDHQGHGQSEGDRKHVLRFDDYVNDVLQLVDLTLRERPELASLPRFLLGHSMGGTITFITAKRSKDLWTGIVFSGPALKANPDVVAPWKVTLAQYLSTIVPKARLDKLDSSHVCSNKMVVQHYAGDPMVDQGGLRIRWGACMLGALLEIQDSLESFDLPFLIVHGEEDKLCNCDCSRELHKKSRSPDKQIITYPDLYHEIFNEACYPRVIKDVTDWLEERVTSRL